MVKRKIKQVIIDTIEEINRLIQKDHQLEKSTETVLFGNNGKLDSLGLINLLVTVEQNIEDEFDINLTIADERAMSQKQSPFRTIGTLVDYIDILLKESQANSDFS